MFTKEVVLKKVVQVLLHIVFWCGVLLFFTYFFGFESNDDAYIMTFSFFLMPITIATTYVSIYKLIPDYLINKRYFLFGLYSLYTLIISGYLILVSVFFGLGYLSEFKYNNANQLNKNLFFVMIAVYLVVIVVSAFKLLKLNLKHAEKTKILVTQILETQLKLKEQELNYLKMQIHPHFLFNTLNTMYGFALKKADETPEMILKLSNLLDYLLYQEDKPFVLLSEEISHIKDYIELERMRFNDTLNVNFKCKNTVETMTIAPMLLLPFIENSFKHGSLKNGILIININLSSTKDGIDFFIENTHNKSEDLNKGIGLQNIQKRLELLYKNNYNLDIDADTNHFKVRLKLKIK
ncbi:sensor histidine kinase [Pontimicrobium aquaticum]|uniref:Histidine kinase n=1 Tax=Pontimicrobium aquaticum TaxID=2565367 RepID=A0A4U0EPA0_9FLAO|nr:histidine kinase [Pontimicrobium aquaticum]TJY33457.1 histidine kinase [Pontimicrobium aquaticum]